MLLDTPLVSTLLAALIILGITYTMNSLINRRIAEVRAERDKNHTSAAEELPLISRQF